jgi:hypothetical protein
MTSNKCGNLDWVPFIPHPWGPDHIPQFDSVTEAPLQRVLDPGSVHFDSAMLPEWEVLHDHHVLNTPVDELSTFKAGTSIQSQGPLDALEYPLYKAKDNWVIGLILLVILALLCLGVLTNGGRIFRTGKDHRYVAKQPESDYVKTI